MGKSSTINALLGEKKVSVSATPGKTKHFQTINLSSSIMLCDCPGLVFPQFATTAADLVCDGVLPIDQLREYMSPATLLAKRIPRRILETTYGLDFRSKGLNGEGSDRVDATDLLTAYAGKTCHITTHILPYTNVELKSPEALPELVKGTRMRLELHDIS